MTRQETVKLLSIFSLAYPMAEITDDQKEFWIVMLADVPFDTAAARMIEHIKTSQYPPTIANIRSPQEGIDHERLKAETAELFAQMEANDQLAIDCPEHLLPRLLKSGVSDK